MPSEFVFANVPRGKQRTFIFNELGFLKRSQRIGGITIMDITVTIINKSNAILMIDFFRNGFSNFKEFDCIYYLSPIDTENNLLALKRVGHV
jgi:hypothetical protein